MKKCLHVAVLCVACLPTQQQAMGPLQNSSGLIVTEKRPAKKLVTQEDYASLHNYVEEKWRPIEEKRRAIIVAQREKRSQEDISPSLFFTQKKSDNAFKQAEHVAQEVELKLLMKDNALQKEIEKKWLPIEKKLLAITYTEREKIIQERDNIIPAFHHSLQKLTPLLPDNSVTEDIQELSDLLIQAHAEKISPIDHAEQTVPEDNHTVLETGATLGVITAGLLGLQQASTSQTRNPFAFIGAGLSMLDSSKTAVATAAGITVVYLGITSAVKSINKWLHSDCEKEKELLTNTFVQKLAELEKKLDARENSLKKEVSRTAEQARENAFDALMKQDKLEKILNPRIKELETAQKRTDSRVVETKEDLEKMRKQLYKEIEKVRRHKDDEINHKLSPIKKQLEALQDKVKNFSKGDQTIAQNEAFAILSQGLQRLGEDMRQIAPSRSHRSSRAPSETGTYTSRAPSQQSSRSISPTNSMYSTRSEAVPRPRPLSALNVERRIEDFLQDISEEHSSGKHSSSENSEIGSNRIRILPPTPPKQEAKTSQNQASNQASFDQPLPTITTTTALKPLSPHRCRSICFGIFKHQPKDTHDPRG